MRTDLSELSRRLRDFEAVRPIGTGLIVIFGHTGVEFLSAAAPDPSAHERLDLEAARAAAGAEVERLLGEVVAPPLLCALGLQTELDAWREDPFCSWASLSGLPLEFGSSFGDLRTRLGAVAPVLREFGITASPEQPSRLVTIRALLEEGRIGTAKVWAADAIAARLRFDQLCRARAAIGGVDRSAAVVRILSVAEA